MYELMSACANVCLYVCVHIYLRVFLYHLWTYECMETCKGVHMYVYINVCIYIYVGLVYHLDSNLTLIPVQSSADVFSPPDFLHLEATGDRSEEQPDVSHCWSKSDTSFSATHP